MCVSIHHLNKGPKMMVSSTLFSATFLNLGLLSVFLVIFYQFYHGIHHHVSPPFGEDFLEHFPTTEQANPSWNHFFGKPEMRTTVVEPLLDVHLLNRCWSGIPHQTSNLRRSEFLKKSSRAMKKTSVGWVI